MKISTPGLYSILLKTIILTSFKLSSIYSQNATLTFLPNNNTPSNSTTPQIDRLELLKEEIPKKFNIETGKNFRDIAGMGYTTPENANLQIAEIKKTTGKDTTKISNLFRRLFEEQGWEHVITKTFPEYSDYTFTIIKNLKFKKMIYSFSGTKSVVELSAQILKSNSIPFKKSIRYIRLMNYYWDMYRNIRDDLKSLFKNNTDPAITQYIFTGHSLGGAMASVTVFDFMQENLIPKSSISPVLITYGQPRAGNYAFSNELMKSVPIVFRIVNDYDLVPSIPPCESEGGKCINEFGKTELDQKFQIEDYERIFNQIPESKREKFYPYHFGGLILVKENGEFLDCTTKSEVDENDPCHKRISLINSDYHTNYFGIHLSKLKDAIENPYDKPMVENVRINLTTINLIYCLCFILFYL